jgi:ADP-ribosylglycohydrolase
LFMDLETYAYTHILGGLYGQALGNAWGMPAYFHPDQTWAHYSGWLDSLVPAPADHPLHAGLEAGQVTAGTQQAMALAQVIIDEGQITVEDSSRAILGWYDQIDGDNSALVGPSTRQAVAALKSGADPHTTGLQGDTSGGAMRINPIGLIHPGNPEVAVRDAIIACTPTHFTSTAVSGACAVAAAIAQAVMPDTTLEDIIETAIRGADRGGRHGSSWPGASVARKIDFAVQLATDARVSEHDRIQNLYDLVGSTPAPADSVPCAFGLLAMTDGDLIETAIYGAALSGDAGTVGAIACAIAGAWHRVDPIPIEYIETIRQANPQYDFEEMAEGLYEIALRNRDATTPQPVADWLSDISS